MPALRAIYRAKNAEGGMKVYGIRRRLLGPGGSRIRSDS
ncbi:hypothetical protein MES5069_220222 [Mesorhizobium escarrei]|uniref:Uncharacterized protein n=1 Tax=Mesorhizobium escarrei TaxID=666018 RepID=A0ABM9DTR9_9HYPH|nr:hypothetical protein MES5069_220222 [Mesorhizobium escarrei]